MAQLLKDASLTQLQDFIKAVYGLADDRLFSISDLISNQERFTMRSLKGIRKGDMSKLRKNLVISFSWAMAVANRLHIDIEDVVWRRFPMLCSYCGKKPCACKKIKPQKRAIIKRNGSLKPGTIAGFQRLFAEVYPPSTRTLSEAGVHLAEEIGELSEAVHHFFGEHKLAHFNAIIEEIADNISCIFGVANSAGIDLSHDLSTMYANNCHVCHKAPCECKFSLVAKFKS